VHANLPALRAVLDAVRAAGIRRGAITGDLVMRGPDPEACIALARETGWPVVVGNTDRRVALEPPRPRSHPASSRVGSRSWTHRHLSAGDLEWLAALPVVVHLTLGPHRIAVVHGLPDDPNSAPELDTPDGELRTLAEELDADAVVTGHTHQPYVRRVGDLLFVNPGSVGEGVPAERRPAWAWLGAGADGLQGVLERVPEPLAALRR
jgi:putative phosphoesterase